MAALEAIDYDAAEEAAAVRIQANVRGQQARAHTAGVLHLDAKPAAITSAVLAVQSLEPGTLIRSIAYFVVSSCCEASF